MTLTEKIQTALIGSDFMGVEDTENLLAEIVGEPVLWYDTKIDDGADDDETEDTYVMRACFATQKGDITIRVYYGNVTEEIGYVDVAEPAA